jgi:hypothetical protein
MIYQAAIDSGLSPQIVNLLPARALQCSWLLKQFSEGRISLTDQQQQQIRAMLNERVEAARQQLSKQAIDTQGASAPMQQPHANMSSNVQTIDLTGPDTEQMSVKQESSQEMAENVAIDQAAQMMHLLQQQQQQQQQQHLLQQQQQQQQQQQTQQTHQQQALHQQQAQHGVAQPSPIARPSMVALRPGMGPDDKVVNTMMYANDVLKDVASILANVKQETEDEERTPLDILTGGEKRISKDDMRSSWYEVGMDYDVPSITDVLPGFSWEKKNSCSV